MKRKLAILLTVLLLIVFCLPVLPVQAAQGSLSASASASSVTVGQTVTVTLTYQGGGAPIASIDAQFRYNASAFEYVSCDSSFIAAAGGAGVVKLSGYASGTAPTSVTAKLTLKAIAAGAGNFSVSTSEFSNDNDYSSLGTPSATVAVSVINPTLSGNANLASLQPSSGTLTPKFKAETTNYTVSVPYTTTSLSLSAKAAVSGAKVSVSGSNALKVGQNTQTVTVTAPNGTTKKYTVVITRQEQQTDTSSSSTPAPGPEDNPLEVEVGGTLMNVSDTQPAAELPNGFSWSSIELNGMTVSAAKNAQEGLTLLYLNSAVDESGAFYLYDSEAASFTLFRPMTVTGGVYALLDMPVDMTAPAGTVAGEVTIGELTVACWQYEDTAQADFYVVYAAGPDGKTGLYVYDAQEGTMQRYREVSLPANTQPDDTAVNAFVRFITDYRNVILICAAALTGVALVVVAVVLLIILLRKTKKCRH